MIQKSILKTDMQFYKEMGGIIEALKGVAATEFFRLQKKQEKFDEFEEQMKRFFELMKVDNFKHPFLDSASNSKFFVLITSDTGFLGKLNAEVVQLALEQYSQEDKFIVIGKQGDLYLSTEKIAGGLETFPGIADNITYSEIEKLRNYIFNKFLEEKRGSATIIYPHFVSFSVQKIQQFQLFPCRFLFGSEKSEDSSFSGQKELEEEDEIILEPSLKKVVESFIKIWVGHLLLGVFWESKLSEWAARVMHLEQSSTEIKKTSKNLKHQYFRTLHELSDKGIREIFASKLALESAE
jgi:ATP synthase F1 gamma subunit